jgi:hypothetical protein
MGEEVKEEVEDLIHVCDDHHGRKDEDLPKKPTSRQPGRRSTRCSRFAAPGSYSVDVIWLLHLTDAATHCELQHGRGIDHRAAQKLVGTR